MRFGLFASITFHVVIICVLFVSFSRPHKADLPPQVAIEVMTPVEYSERLAGRKSAKADKPATPAEVKAPEKEQSAPKEGPEKPAPKPAEQAALPPPPKRSEAEADANSRPASPQPRREQRAKVAEAKPAPEKTAEAKPAAPEMPVQRPRQTTEKAAKPKPVPAGDFDAGRIAALLRSKADQEDRSPARSEARDAAPSTTYEDRIAALLNRDPEAGDRPTARMSEPWRPPSSLQEQAAGLNRGSGFRDVSSCAEMVRARIERNWDLPLAALSPDSQIVRLQIELGRDGSLVRPPLVLNASASPEGRAVADAAIRAALRGQPYTLPPDLFDRCRTMNLTFDPRDMYGG